MPHQCVPTHTTSTRRTSRSFRGVLLAGAAITVALAGACSVGTPSIEKAQVESRTADALEAEVGQRPDSVSCPGNLEATLGATMRCTLSAGGESIGLTVTVDSVDGDNVNWATVVDDAPAP